MIIFHYDINLTNLNKLTCSKPIKLTRKLNSNNCNINFNQFDEISVHTKDCAEVLKRPIENLND